MGRSIFITIFTIPNMSTISTSRSNVIPLIVCGRSKPRYYLSVVCIFVLGILSLFCGEVILSDYVVTHTLLIMTIFDTSE
jgi:hypothetical protein